MAFRRDLIDSQGCGEEAFLVKAIELGRGLVFQWDGGSDRGFFYLYVFVKLIHIYMKLCEICSLRFGFEV